MFKNKLKLFFFVESFILTLFHLLLYLNENRKKNILYVSVSLSPLPSETHLLSVRSSILRIISFTLWFFFFIYKIDK